MSYLVLKKNKLAKLILFYSFKAPETNFLILILKKKKKNEFLKMLEY